ncbi:MAG: FHA domain-containing protein [Anaerolineaceae bacterium]
MSPVKFCPEHGPYDASFDTCPQCGGNSAAPTPIDEMDEMETDIGYGRTPAVINDEDDTVIPGKGHSDFSTGFETTALSSEMGRAMDETQLDGSYPALVEAILWVKSGNRRGRYYPVKHNVVIGRKEGNLILDDLTVSGTHAKITQQGGKYTIWDFGSANGTFINGKRIHEATHIEENDEVKIGDTVMVLKVLSAKKKTSKSTTAGKAKPKSSAKSTVKKASTTSAKKTSATTKKANTEKKSIEK